jgi:hypothetical protein
LKEKLGGEMMNYKELAYRMLKLDNKEDGMADTYVNAIADLKGVTEWEAEYLLLDSLADLLEQKRKQEFQRNNEVYYVKFISKAENRINIIKHAFEIVKWKEVKNFNQLHLKIDRLNKQGHLFAQVFNDDIKEIMNLLSKNNIECTTYDIERKYIELIIDEMDILKLEYYQLDVITFENFLFLDSKESELLRISLLIVAKRKYKKGIEVYLKIRNNALPIFGEECKYV